MSYDITIKRGDTRHAIKAVLKDASGAPVDLTGCSVNFHMAPLNRPAVISRAAHIQDAVTGGVWFVWASGETDTAGIYRAEFEVVYRDGRRETFPNDGYISIQILDDLG
ncbi:BppU family phage baseplate upper protein [Syntrophomonas erecta subsp. sporosyntropha]